MRTIMEAQRPYHSLRRSTAWRGTPVEGLIYEGLRLKINPSKMRPVTIPSRPNYCSPSDEAWGTQYILEQMAQGGLVRLYLDDPDPLLRPLRILPWFVTRNSPQERRLVIDQREGNEELDEISAVQYQDLSWIPAFLEPGDVIWSADVKSAYFGVSLHPEFARRCCIMVGEMILAWTVMLLGLSIAPRTYTLITQVVIEEAVRIGIRLLRYIDDFLGASKVHLAELDIRLAVGLFWRFGLILSFKKSIVWPSLRLKHLGLLIDMPTMSFMVPAEKLADLVRFALALSKKSHASVQALQRFIGKILSLMKAVPQARLRSWSLIQDLHGHGAHVKFLSPPAPGKTLLGSRPNFRRTPPPPG